MKNITVLVSGSGSNLQRIIDCIDNGEISNTKVNLVVADRDCYALERAENHQIPNQLIKRGKDFSENLEKLLPKNTDLIVLAGFLSILSKEFCEKYKGKIINIHPALLPKYGGKGMYGMNVHQAVLENKEKETGITIHYVNEHYDEGEFIFQKSVNIEDCKSAEEIAHKIHELEHQYFPEVIGNLITNH